MHETTPATREILQRLGRDYPELGGLLEVLEQAGGVIDSAFVAAYRASSVPPHRRSLLLRAATGDPSLGIEHLDAAHVASLVAWLEGHGALALGDAPREAVPKGFSTRISERRASFAEFTQAAFLRPWWRLHCGLDHGVPAYAGIDPGLLRPLLERVAAARHLQTSSLAALRAPKGETLTRRQGDWFFDTGVAALDLRNAMVFLADLIDGDRRGGRAQNEIPLALTHRWNLPRLSLPAAIGFCDVVAGIVYHAVDLDQVPADPCGLVPVLDSQHARAFVAGASATSDPLAARATWAHQQRWMVNADWTTRWMGDRRKSRRGVYDTGFMLNADRIPSANASLAFLAPYYAAFNGWRWIRALEVHPDPLVRDTADRLKALVSAGILPTQGMRARDIGNVMLFLHHAGADQDERTAFQALPTVGRWTLGVVPPHEARARASGRKGRARAGRVVTDTRSGDLPLFARIIGTSTRHPARRIAYLLHPGFRGPLPADHPVFTHRVWRTWIVPAGVQFIGPDALEWAACAETDARSRLEAEGFEVIVLAADSSEGQPGGGA